MNTPPASIYDAAVRHPLGRELASRLGLPRPAHLPRVEERPEPVLSPVVVLGTSDGAQAVADLLLSWGADVYRRHEELRDIGSLLMVADDIRTPLDISPIIKAGPAALKKLVPAGRVLTLSRLPDGTDAQRDAARGAIEGFVRSLGHEMRNGATANGIRLADGVPIQAASSQHALRFFLSARSAFIDGQLLDITSEGGHLPDTWDEPLAGTIMCVTGASRGIGAAIARTLRDQGAHVIAVDVMAQGVELSRLSTEIGARALIADVTSEAAGQKIASAARALGGPLDGIVHNAGITRDKMFANMTTQRWDAVMAVNLQAHIGITASLREHHALSDNYRHVGIASTSGIAGNRGQTNYAASKAGVIEYVAALAHELRASGGTANAVAPGFIETDMTAAIPPVRRELARRLSSLQQGGQPEDVAQAVAFFLSPAAGGIHGSTLRVCGQNMVGK